MDSSSVEIRAPLFLLRILTNMYHNLILCTLTATEVSLPVIAVLITWSAICGRYNLAFMSSKYWTICQRDRISVTGSNLCLDSRLSYSLYAKVKLPPLKSLFFPTYKINSRTTLVHTDGVANHYQIFLTALILQEFLDTVPHLLLSPPLLRTDWTTCC